MSYFGVFFAFPNSFGLCTACMNNHSMNDHDGDHGVYCHTEDVGAAAPPTLSSASNPSGSKVPLLAKRVTVAILAQGTSWAVAVTQAFFVRGSMPGCVTYCNMHNTLHGTNAR